MQIEKIDEYYFKIENSFYSLSNSNDIDSLLCMFELTENGYPNHKRYNELIEILNGKIKSEDENVNTQKVLDKINNKYEWWGVPMCTEEFIMQDKKMDYKTLALVMVNSYYKGEKVCEQEGYDYSEIENHRYLYKNTIKENKAELEQLSKWKIRTIQKNIDKLATNGNGLIEICKDKNGKIFYKIYPSIVEGNKNQLGKYVKIDSRILKYLINVYNGTAIKIYCTLVWKLAEGEQQLTYEWIAEKVGLSISEHSKGNLSTIADILSNFNDCKLIKQTEFNFYKGEIYTKGYKYKLTTEEFLNKRK